MLNSHVQKDFLKDFTSSQNYSFEYRHYTLIIFRNSEHFSLRIFSKNLLNEVKYAQKVSGGASERGAFC